MDKGAWWRWGVQTALLIVLVVLLLLLLVRDRREGWHGTRGGEAVSCGMEMPPEPVGQCGGVGQAVPERIAFCGGLAQVEREALRLAATGGLPAESYRDLQQVMQDCRMLREQYDSILVNLQNITTPGYKRIRPTVDPAGKYVLYTRIFSQGPLVETGIWSDVAIVDDTSFLAVTLPDGSIGYTRDGTLRITDQGELRTTNGLALNPPISGIANAATDPTITPSGMVQYTDMNGNIQGCGQIQLYRFLNPAGLQLDRGGYYRETNGAGAPEQGHAGDAGFGAILGGWVEGSNTDTLAEAGEICRLSQSLAALQLRLHLIGR